MRRLHDQEGREAERSSSQSSARALSARPTPPSARRSAHRPVEELAPEGRAEGLGLVARRRWAKSDRRASVTRFSTSSAARRLPLSCRSRASTCASSASACRFSAPAASGTAARAISASWAGTRMRAASASAAARLGLGDQGLGPLAHPEQALEVALEPLAPRPGRVAMPVQRGPARVVGLRGGREDQGEQTARTARTRRERLRDGGDTGLRMGGTRDAAPVVKLAASCLAQPTRSASCRKRASAGCGSAGSGQVLGQSRVSASLNSANPQVSVNHRPMTQVRRAGEGRPFGPDRRRGQRGKPAPDGAARRPPLRLSRVPVGRVAIHTTCGVRPGARSAGGAPRRKAGALEARLEPAVGAARPTASTPPARRAQNARFSPQES